MALLTSDLISPCRIVTRIFQNAGLLCGSTCLRLVEPVVLLASNCNAGQLGPLCELGDQSWWRSGKMANLKLYLSTWQDQMFLFRSDSRHLGAETSERKLRFNLHQPECIAQRLTSIEAILILLIGLPIVAKAIVGHSSLAQPIGWFHVRYHETAPM